MKDNFQWTPELLADFFNSTKILPVDLANGMEQFKSSKAPKKEWEIVAFRYRKESGLLYKLREDGMYRVDPHQQPDGFSIDDMLMVCDIHTIRRLSDGAMFVLNERVCGPLGFDPCYIKSFSINNGCVTVHYENNTSQKLEFLQKLPAPVLTTVDGVDIYPGMEFWPVSKLENRLLANQVAKEDDRGLWQGAYLFSTSEAAETYILENRPLLSLNDVKKVCQKAFKEQTVINAHHIERELTALVKQKLNQ